LHRGFRKVTKAKSIFPTDAALEKMLYLAYMDISKQWKNGHPGLDEDSSPAGNPF